jgi:hypothetical protein
MRRTPNIDETQLTAFALGELDMDADERVRVAAYVESDAEAQRFVDDVRESAGLVVGALDMELVDGLTEFQHEMIERRLRELHGEPQPLRFRPATLHHGGVAPTTTSATAAALARRARFRRWFPTLASAAASVLIIAGTLGFFLRFDRNETDLATGGDAAASRPAGAVIQRTTPPITVTNAVTNDESMLDEDVDAVATEDDGPVEGMVDPKSIPTQSTPKKVPAKAPTAVASAAAKKPVTPAPAAPSAAAPKPKTLRSGDAIEVRRPSVASAMIPSKPAGAARGPKTVNASPVRDGQTLGKGVVNTTPSTKSGPAVAAVPQLYENPFRNTADRPTSSFRVPPYDWSFGRIQASIVNDNRLPPTRTARIEELLNHFTYAYAAPTDNLAVAASVEVATCPWDVNRRLARIALKARDARPGDAEGPVASELMTSVQFNPAATNAWRLIGYETGEAATGGTFPAAELAPGAAVTALYEIIPVAGLTPSAETPANLFTVSVRYRDTAGGQRETIKAVAKDYGTGFDLAGDDFRFASAVAAFGALLRDSRFVGPTTYADVIRWATPGKGATESRERAEFIELAKKARDLAR